FYRRRDRHKVAEERKGERGVGGFAGNEHVVRPNEEADDGDGDAGSRDEGIAEDGLARKSRDDLADHAHGRKNHDVDGRVRVEPEEVLEERSEEHTSELQSRIDLVCRLLLEKKKRW